MELNSMKLKRILVLTFMLCFAGIAEGMNLINMYDTLVLPSKSANSRYQLYAIAQRGFGNKSFDECGCVANVLRIWNKDQNSLKMLEGVSTDTEIGQLRTRVDANDDGVRGHFNVCGDFDVNFAGEVGGWFYFDKQFFLSLQLPIFSMELKNVCWQDLTSDVSADDFRVKQYLTNDFVQNVKELGGLDICGWKRSGVGDLAVIFGWVDDFPQPKKMLKNVRLNARTGLTLPTGKETDVNKIFAFPFGSDGSVAAFLGVGMDLSFGKFCRAGLDVQMIYPFGNTKCRRIKTNSCQTDLLFLTKTQAYQSFGLTQRFNLYLEFYKSGFSLKPGYQFIKKGEDTLYVANNKYFDDLANSAESLQEITIHNIIIDLSYHFFDKCSSSDECLLSESNSCTCESCINKKSKKFDTSECKHKVHPYIGLFAKLPFNGTRVAAEKTIGLTLSIDF